MKTNEDVELYKALKAIAEGYKINVVHDRYIRVENPDFEENQDLGLYVIDINKYKP